MEWDLNRYFKQPDQKPAETDPKAVQPLPDAEETEPKRTNITAQSSKKKRRPRPLPPWILVLVSLLLYALLFHIWIRRFLPEEQVSVGRLLTLVLFSVSFALLSALIGSIGKQHRTQTVFALLVVIIWAILYLMEYFILDSFKNFYTLAGIFTGAGNAGQEDFAARTFGLVGTNLWRVLLFALPILLWFLANRFLHIPGILTRGIRRYLAGAGIALLSLAILFAALLSPDKRKLVEAYNFTGAVRGFGLPMGFALDLLHSGTESSFELEGESSFVPTAQSASGSSEADSRPVQTDESGNLISDSTEAPVAEAYHMLDLNLDGIIETSGSETAVQVSKYLRSLTPSKTNGMTGFFKGKNLILITAEAFSAELIDPVLTPTLYRMATKGIRFTDYYQPSWGGSTSSGEFSVMTGIEPAYGVDSILNSSKLNMDLTIGNQLRKLGYFSRAYHNNSYTYYQRNLTHEHLGYDQFIGMGNGMEAGVTEVWPASDQEMFDFTVSQYIDNQPFSVYYMTVSGHGLYSWLGNTQSGRHKLEVQSLPYSDTVKAYYACNLEVELAMKSLLRQLEAAGIADDTLVVLTSDHYPYCLEKSDTWENDQDYLAEYYGYSVSNVFERDHNALIMWSACLEDKNLEINTPTFSLDIVPTLCNLFGVDFDSRLYVGRDVFSDQEALVFWPDHSWKTEFGSWDASKIDGSEFTPAGGAAVDQAYLDRIRKSVNNKINYSYSILSVDYFALLFGN